MPRAAKISRAVVLSAALAIVDQEGLDALSMRKVAEQLDVKAMSLYRHVANKAAMLDGVHEAVLSEMRLPRRTGHWTADTRALAHSFREALKAHPNALPLFATRPAVTPGSLGYVERALDVLAKPFPDLVVRIHALQSLVSFIIGHSMAQFSASQDDLSPPYAALPPAEFPNLAEIARVNPERTADDEFEFGLDAILNGLSARLGAAEKRSKVGAL